MSDVWFPSSSSDSAGATTVIAAAPAALWAAPAGQPAPQSSLAQQQAVAPSSAAGFKLTRAELDGLKVEGPGGLKELLQGRSLKVSGKKADLVQRLIDDEQSLLGGIAGASSKKHKQTAAGSVGKPDGTSSLSSARGAKVLDKGRMKDLKVLCFFN
jgi:hypothetical protein